MNARFILTAFTAIMIAAGLLTAQSGLAEQTAGSRYGHVILTLVTDARVLPMPADEAQTEAMLFKNEIAAAAAQEVFGEYRPDWFREAKLLEKPRDVEGLQTTRLELTVLLDEKHQPAAKEFVGAYVRKLNDALAAQHAKQMTVYAGRQAEHAEQVRGAERRLSELLEEQGALPAGTGDTESLRRRMQEQERLRAENAMEQAALKKRVEELSAYIDRVQMEPAPVNQDASSRQLREQLDRLEMRLKEEEEADRSFDAPVLGARIADAEFLLAYRKSELQDQAAQEVRQLQQQRRQAAIQLEELAAREKAFEAAELGSLAQSSQYEILEIKIQSAREALHDAVREADKFNAQTALIQKPVVTYDEIAFGMTRPTVSNP